MSAQNQNDQVVVACGSDEQYVMPLVVTLYSLVSHLPPGTDIAIYVLSLGISADSKTRIRNAISNPGISISLEFNEVDSSWVSSAPEIGNYKSAVYLRAFLGNLLPAKCHKVLYLDCDLLVRQSILTLWNQDVEDVILAAAQDVTQPTLGHRHDLPSYKNCLMNNESVYFNSGVLLINLKNWRNSEIGIKMMHYVSKHHSTMDFPDQDALNAICYTNWRLLEMTWNVSPLMLANFDSWQPSPLRSYIESHANEILLDPAICHFTWKKKPWIAGYRVPYQSEWFVALKNSGFHAPAKFTKWHLNWTLRHYYKGAIRKLIRQT